MSDLFRWQEGRQGTGYKKMLLARSNLLKFDLWLLRYPGGAKIPLHQDVIPDRHHVRVNLVLVQPRVGGHFWADKPIFRIGERLNVFYSDHLHSVTPCCGPRVVLSLGLAFKRKVSL